MVLEDCHITTEQTENSEKKGRTQGSAPKSAGDENYYMFTP